MEVFSQTSLGRSRRHRGNSGSRSDRIPTSGSACLQPDMNSALQWSAGSCPRRCLEPVLATLLNDGLRAQFERDILLSYLRCRWFGGKRGLSAVRWIAERAPWARRERSLPVRTFTSMATQRLCSCRSIVRRRGARDRAGRAARGDSATAEKKRSARRHLGHTASSSSVHCGSERVAGEIRRAARLPGLPWRTKPSSRAHAGFIRGAEQFLNALREQILPEALPQTRGWRESGCGGDVVPDRETELPARPGLRGCDRISTRWRANRRCLSAARRAQRGRCRR